MILGAQPILLSGGASGADLQFGMTAGRAGHQVIHFVFEGHGSKAPKSEHVCLTQDMLNEADQALVQANGTLRRSFPTGKQYVNNLLRRNYWQIRDTQSVYAVADFDEQGLVHGGTAWAVQMFIDRHRGQECPVYVFEQKTDSWYAHRGYRNWEAVNVVPYPTNVWTGIGTRRLESNGKSAIRNLLRYSDSADRVRYDLVS